MKLALGKGQQILLTGVTGFVGKVVLEELLRRQDEIGVGTVYVLIRKNKEGDSAETRFQREVVDSPCFANLQDGWVQRVRVVQGDLGEAQCGIDSDELEALVQRLTHIINCAASVEFDLPIQEAAHANITSALHVLAVAKTCTRLVHMVSVSTAYVRPHEGDRTEVPETIVPLPFSANEVYDDILHGRADQDMLMGRTGHPNTYTLTKCLAEHLLMERRGDLPLSIVRPSIVSASWQHPTPGWIDSHAAFAGFVALIGAGYMRVLAANNNSALDIVPCDAVADTIIGVTFDEDSRRDFHHAAVGVHRSCRIDTCVNAIVSYFKRHPVARDPKMKHVGTGGLRFHLKDWRLQKGPGILARTWFSVIRNGKMHGRTGQLLGRLQYLNTRFPYFTHNTFRFDTTRPADLPGFEPKAYIENVCAGVYENLMRRKHRETVFAGRKHKDGKSDIRWALGKPEGNWAIRTMGYMVRKGLNRCTSEMTFDRPSFERARAEIRGDEMLVLVPSHRSYMDFLACSYLLFTQPEVGIPIPHIAAGSEFSKIPFLGWLFRQTQAFYIQRGTGKADPNLIRQIQEHVDEGASLQFFIEGTRSRSRKFLSPKRGLLRSLQSSDVPVILIPVAISYDHVPEEAAFLTELSGGAKPRMALWPLLRWIGQLMRGQVDIGRVHLACGEPVRMDPKDDVYTVADRVVGSLQDATITTTHHLQCFLHHTPIPGVDVEWLTNAIEARGGTVVKSPLKTAESVSAQSELCMRYHWMHLFYPEARTLYPDHPIVRHHIESNGYAPRTRATVAIGAADARVRALVYRLFEPVCRDYANVASALSRETHDLDLSDAKSVMEGVENAFLPNVEDALSHLREEGLIVRDMASGNEYAPAKTRIVAYTRQCGLQRHTHRSVATG